MTDSSECNKLTVCYYELKRNLLTPTTLYGEAQFNDSGVSILTEIFRRFRDWRTNEAKMAFLMGVLHDKRSPVTNSISSFVRDPLFDFSLMGSIFEFVQPADDATMAPLDLEIYIKHCEWVKDEKIPDTVDNLVRYYGDAFSSESFVRMYRETAKQGNWETIFKDLLANGYQCDLSRNPRVMDVLPFMIRRAEIEWHDFKRRTFETEQTQFLNSWKRLESMEHQLHKTPSLKLEAEPPSAASSSSLCFESSTTEFDTLLHARPSLLREEKSRRPPSSASSVGVTGFDSFGNAADLNDTDQDLEACTSAASGAGSEPDLPSSASSTAGSDAGCRGFKLSDLHRMPKSTPNAAPQAHTPAARCVQLSGDTLSHLSSALNNPQTIRVKREHAPSPSASPTPLSPSPFHHHSSSVSLLFSPDDLGVSSFLPPRFASSSSSTSAPRRMSTKRKVHTAGFNDR